MRSWQVKILLTFYFFAVLFLNKEGVLFYGYIVSGIALLAFLFDLKKAIHFNFKNNVYGFRMLILVALGFISLAWAPNFEGSLLHIQILCVLVVSSFIVYYFLVQYKLFNVLVYSVLAYSYINASLALKIPLFKFLLNQSLTFRFIGTEMNPNFLAITLIFSVLLSLLVLQYDRPQQKAYLLLHITNVLLSLYTIILTGSRKGIFFGFALLLISLIINYSGWIGFVKKYFVYILFMGIVVSFLNIDEISKNIEKPIERVNRMLYSVEGSDVEKSTVSRLMFIREGWKKFQDNPWIGYGIGSFRYYYGKYAHNNYIELLFGLGFLGPLIFYSIHFSLLRKMIRNKIGWFIPAFLVILMFMDVGLVSYSEKRIMLIILAVIISIDNIIEKKTHQLNIPEELNIPPNKSAVSSPILTSMANS